MRVLVDESLPVELADELFPHDVSTVRAQRWTGLSNGILLRAAIAAGFEVLVTADQSLPYQQNLARLGISAVIVAGVHNDPERIRPLIPKILDAIATIKPGEAVRVTRRDSVRDEGLARTNWWAAGLSSATQ